MTEGSRLDIRVERLGWLTIVGVAAIVSFVYAFVLLFFEEYVPAYAQLVETLGHIVVTIGVIIVIRKLELPIIATDREMILKEIDQRYSSLISQHAPLMQSTSALGLKKIYENRSAARSDILDAIRGTRRILYIAGVAVYEQIKISDENTSIAKVIDSNPRIDAKFLLLNPHTSPAVIRSFLESDPADVDECLRDGGERFVRSDLYLDISRAFNSFDHPIFHERVRFYRRDPTVWLAITDESVFVEPYTLGRPSGPTEYDRRMGGHMPVFEFDRQRSPVAAILENHFVRLWAISRDGMDPLARGGIHDLHEQFMDPTGKAAGELQAEVFDKRKAILQALRDCL